MDNGGPSKGPVASGQRKEWPLRLALSFRYIVYGTFRQNMHICGTSKCALNLFQSGNDNFVPMRNSGTTVTVYFVHLDQRTEYIYDTVKNVTVSYMRVVLVCIIVT